MVQMLRLHSPMFASTWITQHVCCFFHLSSRFWGVWYRTNATKEHSHTDEPPSTASKIVKTITNAIPSPEVLQQAHPGVAAAADLLLGQASKNKSVDNTDSKPDPQPDQDVGKVPGSQAQDTVGQIPWRQVAGLLHAQGITDPQGLVRPLLYHQTCCADSAL